MQIEPEGSRFFRVVALLALAAAFGFSLYVLWVGWHQPIIEMHGFRQTQTALTVYWLMQGGDWLAYETPVLGSPWAIPMEFPLYQWLVALIASLTSVGIDQVGRAVNYVFFLLCLWPMQAIFRQLRLSSETFVVAAALTLMAPIYLFWSRTVMIESMALFFSLGFVAFYLRWLDFGGIRDAFGALLFAVVAMLVKVTTAIPYGILAAILSILPAITWIRSKQWKTLAIRGSAALLVAGFALFFLVSWVAYSDAIKAQNPIGVTLTSDALSAWNFGTFEQRTGEKLWTQTIRYRAVPEAVGSVVVLWVALILTAILSRRAALAAWLSGLAWLSAFLIFTNLHIVHNYYQYANAILLVTVVAIVIADLARLKPFAATATLALVLTLQWMTFHKIYEPFLKRNLENEKTLRIADSIRRETSPDTAIVVFGYDWSSEIAYYSQRKSLTLPGWVSPGVISAFMSSPQHAVEPLALSAVVYCRASNPLPFQEMVNAVLSQFDVSRVETVDDCEISFIKSPITKDLK